MIVVTGTPRSGTSLMMQTLGHLGYDLTGEKYTSRNMEEFNVKGYYELNESDELHNTGIPDDRFKGTAIKLFGHTLTRTHPRFIKKLIVCVRNNKNFAVKSYMKLMKAQEDFIKPTRANCELIYKANWDMITDYLSLYNKELKYEVFEFEKMVTEPRENIERLAKFLGKENIDIEEAVWNVDVRS